jgi:hypothetical protein
MKSSVKKIQRRVLTPGTSRDGYKRGLSYLYLGKRQGHT